MATFYRSGNGWRAQVARKGIRKSQSGFPTKAAAMAWAGRVESEIMAGVRGEISTMLFGDLLRKYAEERSPQKKGARWELVRIQALGSDRIAAVSLKRLDRAHVAEWRDRRLKAVSAASVRREWNLLSHVCAVGIQEWRLLQVNPFKELPRPKSAQPRTRIASEQELDKLLAGASPKLARVIRFAVETGMRAGEIASLKLSNISGRVAILDDTKNGTRRQVPLSKVALEQIYPMGARTVAQSGEYRRDRGSRVQIPPDIADSFLGTIPPAPTLFGLTSGSISALFARLCEDCKVKGLTFHDLRRTAIVRLAKKLPPMELAKMVGHRDLKMTLNVYYQIDPEDIADKLG